MAHRFHNLDPTRRPHGAKAILRWGIWDPLRGRRRTAPPGRPAPRVEPDLDLIHEASQRTRLTWIGHASFLLQLGGRALLLDPVFSTRVGWVYPRYGQPGLVADQLPRLAAILVTHNHYDHLDLPSLRALSDEVPLIVPSGLGEYLRHRVRQPLVELAWWQSVEVAGLEITLVPTQHWSRRRIMDTNHTLWGGYVVAADGLAFYHASDSSWFDGFREIGLRFPGLQVAMLPIGGYRPGWFMEHYHLNPEQAGQAFETLGARWLLPMHWGAFQLTDEPLAEPAERIRSWWEQAGFGSDRHLGVLAVGETVVPED